MSDFSESSGHPPCTHSVVDMLWQSMHTWCCGHSNFSPELGQVAPHAIVLGQESTPDVVARQVEHLQLSDECKVDWQHVELEALWYIAITSRKPMHAMLLITPSMPPWSAQLYLHQWLQQLPAFML